MTDSSTNEQSAAAAGEPPIPTSARRARLELLVVGVGALVVSMSLSLLVPIISELPARLHVSTTAVNWLLTSTLLVAAVSVPLLGRLGDMYGKRRLLLVALTALTVGSLLDAVTDNIGLLIAGRAIQGMSIAAIPLGISLLAGLLPPARVGSAIALISAMLGVGGALGLPLAGLVAENGDFHLLFWITAAVGAVSVVGTILIVPESPQRSGGRVDVVGALLLTGVLVTLLLPLAEAPRWGWGSPRTLGLLATAVVLTVVFVRFERRRAAPLVDIRSASRRPIVLTNIASVLFGFALFASLIGTAAYVEAPVATGYGFASSTVVGGLCLLPSGLLMLVLSPVTARLIGAIGANRTLALGASIVALGWAVRIVATGSLWEIVLGSTVIGGGTGIGYAAMPSLINRHTPAGEISAANGLNSLARSLGGAFATAAGGSLLIALTVEVGGFAYPSLTSYRLLFAVSGVAGILAAVAAYFVPREPALPSPPRDDRAPQDASRSPGTTDVTAVR